MIHKIDDRFLFKWMRRVCMVHLVVEKAVNIASDLTKCDCEIQLKW